MPAETLGADQARQVYQSIVAKLRDPLLLEYAGWGMVRARIFPVPAGGQAEARFSMTSLLPEAGGIREYTFPFKSLGGLGFGPQEPGRASLHPFGPGAGRGLLPHARGRSPEKGRNRGDRRLGGERASRARSADLLLPGGKGVRPAAPLPRPPGRRGDLHGRPEPGPRAGRRQADPQDRHLRGRHLGFDARRPRSTRPKRPCAFSWRACGPRTPST